MTDDAPRSDAPDPPAGTPPQPPPTEVQGTPPPPPQAAPPQSAPPQAAPPQAAPPHSAPPQAAHGGAGTASVSGTPTWEMIVLAAGALALIGSFLPFYSIDGRDIDWSAWSNAVNLFPVATLVSLYVIAAAVQVALSRFTTTNLPDQVLGFDWSDLRLLLGGLATLTMIAYLFRSFPGGGVDRGIGLFLVLIASIGLLVAAFMERQTKTDPHAADIPPRPADPGDWVVMGSAVALLIGSFLAIFEGQGRGDSANAWDEPLFPLYLVPVILGVAMAAQLAATTLASKGVPDRLAGLKTDALHLVFSGHAALMMLGFLVGNVLFDLAPDPDKGIGFWIMLLAALGLVAGTVMRQREPTSAGPASPPPPPPPRA